MKPPFLLLAAAVAALAIAGASGAALVPGVFDPGATGCPVATYANGVLHLEKNCATATNASAGAGITGLAGQSFTSASFTLASAAQCQGGSPRFNITTNVQTFFLGCNNVAATTNGDGTVTYLFNATTIAAGGQVQVPTGTISSAEILIDAEGTADVSSIVVNGVAQVPAPTTGGAPTAKAQCKKGGWKTFTDPSFKNQGQCVAYVNHHKQKKHGGAPTSATGTTGTTGATGTAGAVTPASETPSGDSQKQNHGNHGANGNAKAKGKNK